MCANMYKVYAQSSLDAKDMSTFSPQEGIGVYREHTLMIILTNKAGISFVKIDPIGLNSPLFYSYELIKVIVIAIILSLILKKPSRMDIQVDPGFSKEQNQLMDDEEMLHNPGEKGKMPKHLYR